MNGTAAPVLIPPPNPARPPRGEGWVTPYSCSDCSSNHRSGSGLCGCWCHRPAEDLGPLNRLLRTLPRDPRSAAVARAWTLQALQAWGIDPGGDFAGDVLLCVSEAVANAVTHGQGSPVLSLRNAGDAVAVGVHDDGPMLPRADNGTEHGRGIKIIAELAESFAVIPDGVGKTVTFLLPIPVPARAAA